MKRFTIEIIGMNGPYYEADYPTIKEAEKHIMEYADWCRAKGCCSIIRMNRALKIKLRRIYEEGKLVKVQRWLF